jgi:2-hydroxy-3-oxopropionate reductase
MNSVGFIGLGTMGKPMALNLLKAGYRLTVHDLDPDSVAILSAQGAKAEKSCRVMARNCDIVITMLPEATHVEEVVFGAGGVMEGLHEGMLFIDMSSITPDTSKRIAKALAEKGIGALDAPVSGGPGGAESGTLSIMAGGSEEAFQKGLPVLKVFGNKILHMGEAGSGQLTKLCNQMLIGIHMQAVCEAYTLATKSGLDLRKVRDALMGGVANSRVLELQGQKIIDRSFEQPAFKLKLHRKDLTAALLAGKTAGVPMFATSLVVQLMEAAMANGYAEFDHTTIMLIEEQLANLQ